MSYEYHPGFSEALDPVLYARTHRSIRSIARTVFGFTITNANNLPGAGPYILAPNHRSMLDPFISGVVPDRAVYFMAKKEIWEKPIYTRTGLTNFMTKLGAFPVDRSAKNRAALIETLDQGKKIISEGRVLGMYGEGTSKNKGNNIGEIFGGISKIAVDSALEGIDAPVLPVGMTAEHLNPLYSLQAVVGEPIHADIVGQHPKHARNEINEKLRIGLQDAVDMACDLRQLRVQPLVHPQQ